MNKTQPEPSVSSDRSRSGVTEVAAASGKLTGDLPTGSFSQELPSQQVAVAETQAQQVRGARPEIAFTLPPPPSVNNLFVTVGRKRVKSARYRSWQHTAGWELQAQRPGRISGPWTCEITLPVRTRADADNLAKPILDLLVAHGVTDDDRHCRKVSVEKTGETDAVVITVRAATSDDYDAQDDFAKSLEVGYAAIRKRKGRGGPGWEPKP